MSWEVAIKLGELVFLAAQALFLGAMVLMKSTFATKREVGTAVETAAAAHGRLDLLEQRVSQLPTASSIEGLRKELSSLGADLRENSVRVETAVLGVKRIEDFLIGGNKS